ncbi:UDP-N-acetylmuramoyl-L-alanine--D-glutamate ligase [Aeromonas simiae]|uniref:UDP-N-acetylmuramoyl-L-alanine--D-glutamate ligase n=1 Tax=Aeromonas simiae TaxID=218936 RepID=UPI00266CB12B|nr:UDP-N-acetylmuramoyl-L-alanine--D-glutamate ligase [Aeromonas simiae]MDO2948238.1 UDP-N-acetylmuramoyl-L-alanine--D-glutamate ligase [Aeromonas simiae]MDO2951719.1 UDP-N-acetylmuramoyl-L-alanine--D-glutamate ligase [Aeromonas simiae]MDO2955573.1 UDP-N-acetylmuramoyl-L-alanine--D-glutamate ligase [Aeromonas simiae]
MVIIIGLGKTGLSCVDYFLAKGVTPLVMDTRANPPGRDQLPPEVELVHGLDEERFKQAHLIVASPGIALATPELKAAAERGVEIVGDIELFVREAKAPIVAITGSNGKSTVTTLVGEMIAEAGLKVGVGGNIGTPALDLLKQPADLYVLELSSFQLETTHSLRAAASVVLNLSEDHMDRYHGMADYRAAKQEIHQHSQHILINRDDPLTRPDVGSAWSSFGLDGSAYGRVEIDGRLWLSLYGDPLLAVDEMKIVGAHNQANALAAMALCDAVGIAREPQLTVLRRFEGLPHRARFVREVNGVRWINDSKATNIGATLAAVAGVREAVKGKLILLAGGQGKGQDFAPLQALLGSQIDKMYCFGQDGALLAALGEQTELVADMDEAIARAAADARPGDWVLLAPACASLDQFKSFEVRGDRFTEQVMAL